MVVQVFLRTTCTLYLLTFNKCLNYHKLQNHFEMVFSDGGVHFLEGD